MIDQKFVSTLESFLNESLSKFAFPYEFNKQIRIKNFIIRQTKKGYVVVDCFVNQQVAFTNFKTSAVAIAKNLSEGKNVVNQVIELDKILLKNYNDAVFYKKSIKKIKKRAIKESRKILLDLALDKADHVKKDLENFIF